MMMVILKTLCGCEKFQEISLRRPELHLGYIHLVPIQSYAIIDHVNGGLTDDSPTEPIYREFMYSGDKSGFTPILKERS